MLVNSYHAKKNAAKKEVKKLKQLKIEATIIPGAKHLGKRYQFFVVTKDKTDKKSKSKKNDNPEEETMSEKFERLNKKFFP